MTGRAQLRAAAI